MTRTNAPRSRSRSLAPLLLAALLALAWTPVSAADDLTDLSLEELLAIELDQMSLTGIRHVHSKGEWMLGYTFMQMDMHGNRSGTTRLSAQQVLAQGYMVAPTDMTMQMHMIHVMYGVTERMTAMLMIPYLHKTMDHVRMDSVRFRTESSGIGDVGLGGLYRFYKDHMHTLTAQAGLEFPTGSIDTVDDVPDMNPATSSYVRLPYPMQLGSGTWDVDLGITYIGQVPSWQWGVHAEGLIHTGRNDNDYRLGNSYEVSAWGGRKLTSWSSFYSKIRFSQWLDITGADPALNPAMVPTADPSLRAGHQLDFVAGINVFQRDGALEGTRVTLEGGVPMYQSLDGPQLETSWLLSARFEQSF